MWEFFFIGPCCGKAEGLNQQLWCSQFREVEEIILQDLNRKAYIVKTNVFDKK